ncbi:unnamed protein product [Rotaria socialis]|uniref:Uncharacterized protein n=1 Tax=Rotaria socialis TaxID=392032 RepID=A0A817W461_9BILA|nr:unnamed protein product [Rotaria socialis]
MIFDQPARNDHDFWLQLHQQSINKTIIDEEDIPESLADNFNLNDYSLIDNNSEYADACSPIPILSSNTYMLQNNNNDTQTSHKRIREEAEKYYIRTAEHSSTKQQLLAVVAVDFSPSILRAHFPTITDSQINAALKHIYRFGEKVL